MSKAFSKLIKPEHLKAARVVGYALTLGNAEAWQGFARWAAMRLEVEERAALAWAALRSLDAETAALTVEAAFEPEAGAGMPDTTFGDPIDQAMHWVSWVNSEELDAYAVAIFNALPDAKKRDFLEYAERVAA